MIIQFSAAVINVDKFIYATVAQYEVSYEKRWRVEVKMEGGVSFSWKGYKAREEAEDKLNLLFQAMDKTQYRINELVP